MTEQTPAQTPVQDSESPVEPQTEAPEGNDTGEAPKGNREAKYRTERNEAREQVATLTARIEQLQRLDIERVAAESLSAPVDFWLSGNDVNAYLTDDGLVDAERVREDAKLLVTERPGLRRPQPAVDHSQGSGYVTPGKAQPSWSDLLKD